jgi:glutathione S-transferase
VAKIEGIAIGLADLAVAHLIEEFRLNGAPPPPHVLAMRERVAYILDAVEVLASTFNLSAPHLGTLALAAVLKYLDFRPGVAPGWRNGREGLGAWLQEMEQRPSIRATEFELVI